jgi:hypothetical protein
MHVWVMLIILTLIALPGPVLTVCYDTALPVFARALGDRAETTGGRHGSAAVVQDRAARTTLARAPQPSSS